MVQQAAETAPRPVRVPVYLDYQATTPTDPRVVESMLPFFTEKYGNAHSEHRYGWEAEASVNVARKQVADLIGAKAEDVIFTSGATESNNLAIKGLAWAYKGHRNHIVTVATEHKCVLESCRRLAEEGFETTYLSVDSDGLIDLAELEAAITPRTLLVSVMAVNNEIGVIQPLKQIGAICREKDVFFHTDAAQGVGKIRLDVEDMNIDLMSISGHKLYGPKGIGALYVRRDAVKLRPVIDGGGHEHGLRSGTLPTPLCIGLGTACRIAAEEMEADATHLRRLADRFLDRVLAEVPEARLNGHRTQRFPGNMNLTFPGVDGNRLMAELRELAISSGSACASATNEPSYVLAALGLSDRDIHSSVRIGFGRMTSEAEVDFAAETVIRKLSGIRRTRV